MQNLPTNRREAIMSNSLYYFTGKACKNGHTAKRYVRNCECVECRKDYSIRYQSGQNYQQSEVIKIAKEIGALSSNRLLDDSFIEFERISSKPEILVQLEAIRDQFTAIIASNQLG